MPDVGLLYPELQYGSSVIPETQPQLGQHQIAVLGMPSEQDQGVVSGTQSQQRQSDATHWVVPETQPQLGQCQSVVSGTQPQ